VPPEDLASPRTRHVIVDMQRIFAEDTPWHTPALTEILPNVTALARAFEGRNHFAKFMVPAAPHHADGRWQNYYERWSMLTTQEMDAAMLDIVSPLEALVEPERLIEKPTYSIFKVPGVMEGLRADGVETLIFSGVETDICVLAGLMEAVDAGFHTVVVGDAVGSSAPKSHAAILGHVLPRMPEQVDIMTTADVVARAKRS